MNAYTQTRRLRAAETQLAAPFSLTPNQTERLAMLLRTYAWLRGAPRQEDDEEQAMRAVAEVSAALSLLNPEPTPAGEVVL